MKIGVFWRQRAAVWLKGAVRFALGCVTLGAIVAGLVYAAPVLWALVPSPDAWLVLLGLLYVGDRVAGGRDGIE